MAARRNSNATDAGISKSKGLARVSVQGQAYRASSVVADDVRIRDLICNDDTESTHRLRERDRKRVAIGRSAQTVGSRIDRRSVYARGFIAQELSSRKALRFR